MSQKEFNNACENGNIDIVKKMALNNIYDWTACKNDDIVLLKKNNIK